MQEVTQDGAGHAALEVRGFEPEEGSPTSAEVNAADDTEFSLTQWLNRLCLHNEAPIKTLDTKPRGTLPG